MSSMDPSKLTKKNFLQNCFEFFFYHKIMLKRVKFSFPIILVLANVIRFVLLRHIATPRFYLLKKLNFAESKTLLSSHFYPRSRQKMPKKF